MKASTPVASRNPRSEGEQRTSRRPQRMGRPRKASGKAPLSTRGGAGTEASGPRILTIGHSTRAIGKFVRLLRAHAVTRVVDVRTVPRSRHNPQFNCDNLPASLRAAGIAYLHLPALGGLRRTTADSPNKGWRNLSFRGYADHMQSPEFHAAIDQLIELAAKDRLALMCAEAVPWRCHRSLIADALLVRGLETADISSATRLSPHRLTPFAKMRRGNITYPAPTPSPARRAPTAPPRCRVRRA